MDTPNSSNPEPLCPQSASQNPTFLPSHSRYQLLQTAYVSSAKPNSMSTIPTKPALSDLIAISYTSHSRSPILISQCNYCPYTLPFIPIPLSWKPQLDHQHHHRYQHKHPSNYPTPDMTIPSSRHHKTKITQQQQQFQPSQQPITPSPPPPTSKLKICQTTIASTYL